MKLLRCLAIMAGLAAAPATAQTPVTYVDDGAPLFTVTVPDFWTVRTGGIREITDKRLGEPRVVGRVIGLRPENDDSAWMGFVSPDGVATFEDGRNYLREIANFMASDPVVSDRVKTRIGGRSAEVIRATGRRNGRFLNITATLIDLPGSRMAMAFAVLEGGGDPGYVDEMNDVFSSFRAR